MLETFVSLRLEGMEPDAEDIQSARDYVAGRVTLDEILQRTLANVARHGGANPADME
ncbi:hypothetical protein IHE71_08430 [Myceligenerans sp. TRM 65318]|uniref:Antitoxin VbhA domain-containing protein n=1 Tax=Myceligenerans pegani TaxID=2776917 RepID=A0ABR9MWG4_9MICO|nr:hypothetical protein [Myceligenerans sp. TRM 65318]MBE3018006.1 hypothetical protein [Myceligenerans sp. TRM 65318]